MFSFFDVFFQNEDSLLLDILNDSQVLAELAHKVELVQPPLRVDFIRLYESLGLFDLNKNELDSIFLNNYKSELSYFTEKAIDQLCDELFNTTKDTTIKILLNHDNQALHNFLENYEKLISFQHSQVLLNIHTVADCIPTINDILIPNTQLLQSGIDKIHILNTEE